MQGEYYYFSVTGLYRRNRSAPTSTNPLLADFCIHLQSRATTTLTLTLTPRVRRGILNRLSTTMLGLTLRLCPLCSTTACH
jgi:hypothetical protein